MKEKNMITYEKAIELKQMIESEELKKKQDQKRNILQENEK